MSPVDARSWQKGRVSMKVGDVNAIMFSGAGTTRAAAERMGAAFGLPFKLCDITPQGANAPDFGMGELAIFAVPAFGGRVPAPALERIAACTGDETPAVLMVTYGNRAVDDTFLELADTVAEHGFVPVAGVAVVAHHSLMTNVAIGRPDEEDFQVVDSVARDVLAKLAAVSRAGEAELREIPGSRPYTPYGGVPFKAQADESLCTACGACAAQCPVGAIDAGNPSQTDADACISCTRCIAACPVQARALSGGDMLESARAGFAAQFGEPKESYALI